MQTCSTIKYVYLLFAFSIFSSYTLSAYGPSVTHISIQNENELTYVFSHIPKAAGTSFEDFLGRTQHGFSVCGPRRLYFRYKEPLQLALSKNASERGCHILTSETNIHSIRLNSNDHSNLLRIMVFFRHPVALKLSHLESGFRDLYTHDKNLTVENYTSTMMRSFQNTGVGLKLGVYMNWLAGHGLGKQPNPRQLPVPKLQEALKTLESLWFIGIVEWYEESLCLLKYQWRMIEQSTCECAAISSSKRNNVFKSKLFWNQKQMNPIIMSVHHFENVLYAKAVEIFFKRIIDAEASIGYDIVCDRDLVDAMRNNIL